MSSPSDLFASFVANLEEPVAGLMTRLSSDSPGEALTALLLRARSGELPLAGRLDSTAAYQVHGAGSRFTVASGDVLDVDVDSGGRLVWDAWRIREYALARNEEVDIPAVVQALQEYAASGVITETKPGWFALREPFRAKAQGAR
jgi:hypothetical protein